MQFYVDGKLVKEIEVPSGSHVSASDVAGSADSSSSQYNAAIMASMHLREDPSSRFSFKYTGRHDHGVLPQPWYIAEDGKKSKHVETLVFLENARILAEDYLSKAVKMENASNDISSSSKRKKNEGDTENDAQDGGEDEEEESEGEALNQEVVNNNGNEEDSD